VRKLLLIMTIFLGFSIQVVSCKKIQNNQVYVYKSQDGKMVPYESKNAHEAMHRQLGSMQINPSAYGIDISLPGNYILADNMNTSNASGGIRITASDVDLDLNGFVLSNDAGVGIDVGNVNGLENIVIHNGTVNNCAGHGVQINHVENLVVNNVLSTNNINSGNGFDFGTNCTNTLITNCQAINNENGINIQGGQLYELRECLSTDNAADGYAFGSSVSNLEDVTMDSCIGSNNGQNGVITTNFFHSSILRSQFNSNDMNGIDLTNTQTNIHIEDCQILHVGQVGILIETTSNNITLKNNAIASSGSTGILFEGLVARAVIKNNSIYNAGRDSGSTADGISIEGTDCVISGNEIVQPTRNGIVIQSTGGNNLIRGNNCIQCGNIGIIATFGSQGNILRANSCIHCGSDGFNVSDGENILRENSSTNNGRNGYYLRNSSSASRVITIKDCEALNNGDNGIQVDVSVFSAKVFIISCISCNNGIYGILSNGPTAYIAGCVLGDNGTASTSGGTKTDNSTFNGSGGTPNGWVNLT
jgi:parallel beta-helix repeat protein